MNCANCTTPRSYHNALWNNTSSQVMQDSIVDLLSPHEYKSVIFRGKIVWLCTAAGPREAGLTAVLAVPTHDTKRLLLLLPVKNRSARSPRYLPLAHCTSARLPVVWGRRAKLWLGRAFVQPLKEFCLSVMLEVLHLMAIAVPNTR